jgi:hypothetical protein
VVGRCPPIESRRIRGDRVPGVPAVPQSPRPAGGGRRRGAGPDRARGGCDRIHDRSRHGVEWLTERGAATGGHRADRSALSSLVVAQADVGSTRAVILIPNGNRITQPTLDLCNGTFASEKLRVARLQVAELDSNGRALLSTEAVTYPSAAATGSAFAELRKVRAECPKKPVTSPVGEGTATTAFKAAPDRDWPSTPGVERLAYSFTTTSAGSTSSSIAVYLRRGRVLLGVYFPQPSGSQPAVHGRTSIAGIVGLFEARLARLPGSVVGGSA